MSTESLELGLRAFRLPSFLANSAPLAEQAAEGRWGHVQYLDELAALEAAERGDRRIARLLKDAKLRPGTLPPLRRPLEDPRPPRLARPGTALIPGQGLPLIPTGPSSHGSPTPSGSAPEPTASLGLRPPKTRKRSETGGSAWWNCRRIKCRSW